MNKVLLFILCFVIAGCSGKSINTKSGSENGVLDLAESAYANEFGARIYSQDVIIPNKKGFKIAQENQNGSTYILELIPESESTQSWSRMVTLAGAKDAALSSKLTPIKYLNLYVNEYRNTCPGTFNFLNIGARQFDTYDAQIAVLSCGNTSTGESRFSETTLFIVLKGIKDYITIQSVERGIPQENALILNRTTWINKLRSIIPLKTSEAG